MNTGVKCYLLVTGSKVLRLLPTDSGASRHIAMSQSGMTNMRPVPAETTITFGNGTQASVEAVGDVVLRIPGSEVDTLTLTDVYHVPEATMNLFSIRSAVNRGVEVPFSKDKVWRVLHPRGRTADCSQEAMHKLACSAWWDMPLR